MNSFSTFRLIKLFQFSAIVEFHCITFRLVLYRVWCYYLPEWNIKFWFYCFINLSLFKYLLYLLCWNGYHFLKISLLIDCTILYSLEVMLEFKLSILIRNADWCLKYLLQSYSFNAVYASMSVFYQELTVCVLLLIHFSEKVC